MRGIARWVFVVVLLLIPGPLQGRVPQRIEPPTLHGPLALHVSARLSCEKMSGEHWIPHDFRDDEGDGRVSVGDRLSVEVRADRPVWTYVLVVRSPTSWQLVSSGAAGHGSGGSEWKSTWIADDEVVGASSLLVIAAMAPLPGVDALRTRRDCATDVAPAGDAVCAVWAYLANRLPAREIVAPSNGTNPDRHRRTRPFFPVVGGAGRGLGFAMASMPFVGVERRPEPEPLLLEAWSERDDGQVVAVRILQDGSRWTLRAEPGAAGSWLRAGRLGDRELAWVVRRIRDAGVLGTRTEVALRSQVTRGTTHRWTFVDGGRMGRLQWKSPVDAAPPVVTALRRVTE